MVRVWIGCANNYASNSRADDRISARRRATKGTTRFERYIQSRPTPIFLRSSQSFYLRVCRARTTMPSFSDDFPIADNHRTHSGIWRS